MSFAFNNGQDIDMFFSLAKLNDITSILLQKGVFRNYISLSKFINLKRARTHGVMVSTLDFESSDPSSNLGGSLHDDIFLIAYSRLVLFGIRTDRNDINFLIFNKACKRVHFHRVFHIECFHSRGQLTCKFIETKESIYIGKEFNSHRTGLGHQHGRRFLILGHQYGCRDVI